MQFNNSGQDEYQSSGGSKQAPLRYRHYSYRLVLCGTISLAARSEKLLISTPQSQAKHPASLAPDTSFLQAKVCQDRPRVAASRPHQMKQMAGKIQSSVACFLFHLINLKSSVVHHAVAMSLYTLWGKDQLTRTMTECMLAAAMSVGEQWWRSKTHLRSSPTWRASAGSTPSRWQAVSNMSGLGFSAQTSALTTIVSNRGLSSNASRRGRRRVSKLLTTGSVRAAGCIGRYGR